MCLLTFHHNTDHVGIGNIRSPLPGVGNITGLFKPVPLYNTPVIHLYLLYLEVIRHTPFYSGFFYSAVLYRVLHVFRPYAF